MSFLVSRAGLSWSSGGVKLKYSRTVEPVVRAVATEAFKVAAVETDKLLAYVRIAVGEFGAVHKLHREHAPTRELGQHADAVKCAAFLNVAVVICHITRAIVVHQRHLPSVPPCRSERANF